MNFSYKSVSLVFLLVFTFFILFLLIIPTADAVILWCQSNSDCLGANVCSGYGSVTSGASCNGTWQPDPSGDRIINGCMHYKYTCSSTCNYNGQTVNSGACTNINADGYGQCSYSYAGMCNDSIPDCEKFVPDSSCGSPQLGTGPNNPTGVCNSPPYYANKTGPSNIIVYQGDSTSATFAMGAISTSVGVSYTSGCIEGATCSPGQHDVSTYNDQVANGQITVSTSAATTPGTYTLLVRTINEVMSSYPFTPAGCTVPLEYTITVKPSRKSVCDGAWHEIPPYPYPYQTYSGPFAINDNGAVKATVNSTYVQQVSPISYRPSPGSPFSAKCLGATASETCTWDLPGAMPNTCENPASCITPTVWGWWGNTGSIGTNQTAQDSFGRTYTVRENGAGTRRMEYMCTNPTPGIGINPTSFNFTGSYSGGPAPAAQTITITNTGAASLNWAWDRYSPIGGTASTTCKLQTSAGVDVPINTGGTLAAGANTASGYRVVVAAPGAPSAGNACGIRIYNTANSAQSQSAPVTHAIATCDTAVVPASNGAVSNVTQNGYTLSWQRNASAGPNDGNTRVRVANTFYVAGADNPSGTYSGSANYPSCPGYPSAISTTTSATQCISFATIPTTQTSIAVSGGQPGTTYYNRLVALCYDVNDSYAQGAFRYKDYVFTTQTTAVATYSYSVVPASVSFSATQGGSLPGSQSFTVTNTGNQSLSMTASDNVSWASVSPTSFTLATNGSTQVVNVSISDTSLSPNSYSGIATFSNVQAGNQTRPINYTVNAGVANNLSITKSGQGTVTSSPSGISCGAGCTSQTVGFPANTSVVLTATAASGRIFTGWGGACSGRNTQCTVLMDAAKSVTANFAIDPNYKEF